MIQIVIPIYYVLIKSKDLDEKKYAEEDAFYMFHNLMCEIYGVETADFDNTLEGVQNKMKNIFILLKTKDVEFHKILDEKGLLDTAFPFKWIMQLFTTIFKMPIIFNVWDKILSDSYRFNILEYFCVVLLFFKKEELIEYSFEKCMEVIQNPGEIDFEKMFFIADQLRRTNKKYQDVFNEYLELKLKRL